MKNAITTRQFSDLLRQYRAEGTPLEWEALTWGLALVDFCYESTILEDWEFVSISCTPAMLPELEKRLAALGVEFDFSALDDLTNEEEYQSAVSYGSDPYFYNDDSGNLAAIGLRHARTI